MQGRRVPVVEGDRDRLAAGLAADRFGEGDPSIPALGQVADLLLELLRGNGKLGGPAWADGVIAEGEQIQVRETTTR
jgi:hypothetical protein